MHGVEIPMCTIYYSTLRVCHLHDISSFSRLKIIVIAQCPIYRKDIHILVSPGKPNSPERAEVYCGAWDRAERDHVQETVRGGGHTPGSEDQHGESPCGPGNRPKKFEDQVRFP